MVTCPKSDTVQGSAKGDVSLQDTGSSQSEDSGLGSAVAAASGSPQAGAGPRVAATETVSMNGIEILPPSKSPALMGFAVDVLQQPTPLGIDKKVLDAAWVPLE